jgi:bifunctional NMN adenylyltransferase/nudix hydrolase
METPSFGFIVGRFQVHDLHDGHLELIRAVRALHKRVIIFLGVPPTLATKRNPLDFITRKRMIESAFPDITCVPLKDMGDDHVWSEELDKQIESIAQYGKITLYGGRDSFIPAYHGRYKPVELPIKVGKSGEEVRAEISNNIMATSDFRAGVIYATQNRFPAVIPTVDIAIMEANYLLLGRKPHETLFRFVGGHASPEDKSLEMAARREAEEETNLSIESLVFVGTARIEDWRWSRETDRIITTLFVGYTLNPHPAKAGDDIQEIKWFDIEKIDNHEICVAHRPLLDMLRLHYERHKHESDSPNRLVQAHPLAAVSS